MQKNDLFATNKRAFKGAFQQTIRSSAEPDLSEAAFPAYAHRQWLIDMIFWARLRVAQRYVLAHTSPGALLDFGCGSGVFSTLMSQHGYAVTAFDLTLKPHQLLLNHLVFPPTIIWHEAQSLEDIGHPEPYQAICALDVLEHLEDIETVLLQIKAHLAPTGVFVVSGPTENALYRIGRKLAGKAFDGHYHHSNIYDIKRAMSRHFSLLETTTLYPFLPLFEVVVATHAQ